MKNLSYEIRCIKDDQNRWIIKGKWWVVYGQALEQGLSNSLWMQMNILRGFLLVKFILSKILDKLHISGARESMQNIQCIFIYVNRCHRVYRSRLKLVSGLRLRNWIKTMHVLGTRGYIVGVGNLGSGSSKMERGVCKGIEAEANVC